MTIKNNNFSFLYSLLSLFVVLLILENTIFVYQYIEYYIKNSSNMNQFGLFINQLGYVLIPIIYLITFMISALSVKNKVKFTHIVGIILMILILHESINYIIYTADGEFSLLTLYENAILYKCHYIIMYIFLLITNKNKDSE